MDPTADGFKWSEEAYRKAKEQAPTPLPPPIKYCDFELLPVEKPKPLIDNLLDCGSRILFAGGSKTFKTWLQCELALSLAAGVPWLGFDCHKSRVLYVNFELREYYMQRRLAEIRKARAIQLKDGPLFIWNLRGVSFTRDQFIADLLVQCQQMDLDIAFIDPFYKILQPIEDENNQTQMGAVLRSFDPVNALDVGTSFGVHFSKGNQAGKEPEDRISGAGTLARDADNIITLTKHEEHLAFTVDFIVRDHPPIESFVVKWQSPVMVRTELDPTKIKQPRGRKESYEPDLLLDLIARNDDELSTTDLIRLAVEQLHWTERTIQRKLASLEKQSKLFKSKISGNWNIK